MAPSMCLVECKRRAKSTESFQMQCGRYFPGKVARHIGRAAVRMTSLLAAGKSFPRMEANIPHRRADGTLRSALPVS